MYQNYASVITLLETRHRFVRGRKTATDLANPKNDTQHTAHNETFNHFWARELRYSKD